MKARLVVSVLSVAFLLFAACSDDDTVAPPAPTGFNTSMMPITVPNVNSGYANMAVDGAGNVLLPTLNGVLHTVSRSTGRLGIVAANIGRANGGPYQLVSCVYDPAADRIYVGEAGDNPTRIYSVDPTDGSSSLLSEVFDQGYPLQLLIAPSGFGAFGGQLLVFTYVGSGDGIYAIDLSSPASRTTVSSLKVTGAAFGPDGTLYATDWTAGRVVTISAADVVTEYATGIPNPEGIVVNAAGTKMYVAGAALVPAGPDSIYSVTIPGAVVTALPFEPDLDDGFGPTGFVLDGAGKLIFNGGESEQVIDYVDL